MSQDPASIPAADEVVIDATVPATDAPAAVPSPAADASAVTPVAPDAPAPVVAPVADTDPSGGTAAEGASVAPSTDSNPSDAAPTATEVTSPAPTDASVTAAVPPVDATPTTEPPTDPAEPDVAPESFSPPASPTLPDPEVPVVTELPNATVDDLPAEEPTGESAVGDYVAPPMTFKIAERLDQEGLENYIRTYPEVNLPDNHNLSVDELRHYAGWVTQASQQGKSAAQFPKPRGLWLTNYRIAHAAAEAAAIAVADVESGTNLADDTNA